MPNTMLPKRISLHTALRAMNAYERVDRGASKHLSSQTHAASRVNFIPSVRRRLLRITAR
jgi:hypothetical protein